jgi:hypothetical protein
MVGPTTCLSSGPVNDLYVFDLSTTTWTDLSGAAQGPTPRQYFAFTAAFGKLFTFGGFDDTGSWIQI